MTRTSQTQHAVDQPLQPSPPTQNTPWTSQFNTADKIPSTAQFSPHHTGLETANPMRCDCCAPQTCRPPSPTNRACFKTNNLQVFDLRCAHLSNPGRRSLHAQSTRPQPLRRPFERIVPSLTRKRTSLPYRPSDNLRGAALTLATDPRA
ncbi:hypothetical protein PMIN02_012960 [Paraphaeosphaeria minitans]